MQRLLPALLLLVAAIPAGVALARASDDGGSGTYTGTGTTLNFDVVNTGTTSWRYIVFVPPGSVNFTDGQATGAVTAPCFTGNFVAKAGELECGPFSPAVPNGTRVMVVARTSTAFPCGTPIQFNVNSTGTPPYPRAADITFAGSCGGQPPPPPPPPPPPTVDPCDKYRARIAELRAELASAKATLAREEQGEKNAKRELKRLKGAAGKDLGLLFAGEDVAKVLAEAELEVAEWGDAIESSDDFIDNLENSIVNNERKLAACERAPAFTAGTGASCRPQETALAKARGRAAGVAFVARKFGPIDFVGAAGKLDDLAGRARRVASTPKGRPQAAKLRAVADAAAKLASTLRRASSHVSAVKKQSKAAAAALTKAKTSLAKCKAGKG